MRCLLGRGAGKYKKAEQHKSTAHPKKSDWFRKAGTGAKDTGLEVGRPTGHRAGGWETS